MSTPSVRLPNMDPIIGPNQDLQDHLGEDLRHRPRRLVEASRSFGTSACFAGSDPSWQAARPTAWLWLFMNGVGIWGLNIPVGWGFAIINFVWWIGIGHAGTLISAILAVCSGRTGAPRSTDSPKR